MAYSGENMHTYRKQHYVSHRLNLDSTLTRNWTELTNYEKEFYNEGAKRAIDLNDINEAMKVFEQANLEQTNARIVTDIRQLRVGDHVSYPARSLQFDVPFANHHAILSNIYEQRNEVQVIHISGKSTSSAKIRQQKVNLGLRLQNKQVRRITYSAFQPFNPDTVLRRGREHLNRKGLHGNHYRVYSQNCEHIANFLKTGVAYSLQTNSFHIPV